MKMVNQVRRTTSISLAGALVFILAGCTGNSPSGEPPSSTATSSEDGGEPIPPDGNKENETVLPSAFSFTDCQGVLFLFNWPKAYADEGTNPSGWPRKDDAINAPEYVAYECGRVAWGRFERGPVLVLLETHGEFEEPATCQDPGAYVVVRMIESIWLNDQEIVDFARNSYGLPVYYADIIQVVDSSLPVRQTVWSWSTPDGAPASISFPALGEGSPNAIDQTHRLFWPRGSAVGFMDLDMVHTGNVNDQPPTQGRLPEPFIYGRAFDDPNFVTAFSTPVFDASLSARLRIFADADCKEPM